MPTKQEVYDALCAEAAPISIQDFAKKLGVKRDDIVMQLERMIEPGYAIKNEEGQWSITQTGKKLLPGELNDKEKNETTRQSEFAPEPLTATGPPQTTSKEEAKLTEYQRFCLVGEMVGITKDLISLTADHVWNGGDFPDLKWVLQAMNEMGIRYDLSIRWLNSWLRPTERQRFPELEFFADSYEQISTSIDRTGLRPQLRAAFEAALARIRNK